MILRTILRVLLLTLSALSAAPLLAECPSNQRTAPVAAEEMELALTHRGSVVPRRWAKNQPLAPRSSRVAALDFPAAALSLSVLPNQRRQSVSADYRKPRRMPPSEEDPAV
jgi:hypothetical protein